MGWGAFAKRCVAKPHTLQRGGKSMAVNLTAVPPDDNAPFPIPSLALFRVRTIGFGCGFFVFWLRWHSF